MARHPGKTLAENLYIAERKFKYHMQGDLSFEQIRTSLNQSYGGFNEQGLYHNDPKLDVSTPIYPEPQIV